jgi:hypothetical protein
LIAERVDEAAAEVTDSAAAVVARLTNRMSDVVETIQQYPVTEITELRGEAQLLDLFARGLTTRVPRPAGRQSWRPRGGRALTRVALRTNPFGAGRGE